MSTVAPTPAPRLASRPTAAGPSRPVAARPVAARPVAARPPARTTAAAAGSSTSVKSSNSTGAARAPVPAAARVPAPPSVQNIQSTPAGGGKDTSSSAGKVFAKPSKDWVLPERAKPGRKVSVEEPDSKRQSQNRLSQRAHRARRTDYITTLEERIRQFENDEIHSNVRLQEVARALKADNERLKEEVTALETSIKASASSLGSPAPKGWEEERGMLLNEVRVLRDEVASLRGQLASNGAGMLGAGGVIDIRSLTGTPIGHTAGRTPTAMINGADPDSHHHRDLSCPICPNPDPDCPCQRSHLSSFSSHLHSRPHSHSNNLPSHHHIHLPDPTLPLGSAVLSPHLSTHSCGFCASNDECLCRAVQIDGDDDQDMDIKPDISILTPPTASMRLEESCGLCADGGFCACAVARGEGSPGNSVTTNTTSEGRAPWSTSVTSNSTSGVFTAGAVSASASAPAAAAAVPLRKLRLGGGSSNGVKKSIWALDSGVATASTPIAPLSKAEAQCTGDPRNCDACKNDTFGKEFCENFFTDEDPPVAPGPSSATPAVQKSQASSATKTSDIPGDSSNRFWKTHDDDESPSDIDLDNDPQYASYSSSSQTQAPLILSCCGNAGLCNHPQGGCSGVGEVIGIGGLIPGLEGAEADKETIRVDQAWRALKAHPNAKFASLAFLADVVAQRAPVSHSRASTPTGVGVGTGVGVSPARPMTRRAVTGPGQRQQQQQPSLSAGISSLGIASPASSPAPQDSMLGLGAKRGKRKVVETSALRDALHLLDAVEAGAAREDGEIAGRDVKRPRMG